MCVLAARTHTSRSWLAAYWASQVVIVHLHTHLLPCLLYSFSIICLSIYEYVTHSYSYTITYPYTPVPLDTFIFQRLIFTVLRTLLPLLLLLPAVPIIWQCTPQSLPSLCAEGRPEGGQEGKKSKEGEGD